ncbi:MAG: hypothetical protein R6V58_17565 [Planctomycetota bacterium]
MRNIARSLVVAALVGLVAPAVSAGESVRLLAGFEWEQFHGKLGRRGIIGQPHPKPPAPRWRATAIEKLEDVGEAGFMIFARKSSRDWPGTWVVRTHATQGHFAWKCRVTDSRWRYIAAQTKKKYPGPWPAHEPAYDPQDHFLQRECQLWKQGWKGFRDWSGFERLRFDVTAVGAPIRLGFRVRDGSGPLVRGKPTGIRTGLAVFQVPAGKTVCCDVPLAELARVAELDLGKVHRYNIRLNGLPSGEPPEDLYMDNVRLVAKGAEPKLDVPLLSMEGEPHPFARPVDQKPPLERDPEKLERELGPVERLGPVVINEACLFSGGAGHMGGHFGGSGATYFQTARRAVVAYDNDRLLVVMAGATAPPKSRKKRRAGLMAIASFDGGKTWTSPNRKSGDVLILPWYLRAGYFADRYGNVYGVGTPNCDSYNEGQDICFHRLAFLGDRWEDDRFAIIHQDGYKCPNNCQAIQLENGRLWASWGDGFGGCLARHSDDDGYTWPPCKDASKEPPRPFYSADLAALGKPDAPKPPKRILLWPTPSVVGPLIAPYKSSAAVFGGGRRPKWQVHDGDRWLPPKQFPAPGRGLLTVTVLGGDHPFISRGAGYNNLGKEVLAEDLVVVHGKAGEWKKETLARGKIGSAIVTASGDAIYCFYVEKVGDEEKPEYEVRYRRWKGGAWGESVKIATERRRINHLAAPQYSPPSYAAIFWDPHFEKRTQPSEVKFVRVPNQ